jgi:hypothetical protein
LFVQQLFGVREQTQQHYSPIFIGLIGYQLVEILDVALSFGFIGHGLHSIEARRSSGCCKLNAQMQV